MKSSSRFLRGLTDIHKTTKRRAAEHENIRSTRYRKPEGKSSIAQVATHPKGPPSPARRVSNALKLKDSKPKLHKPSNESSRRVEIRPGSRQPKPNVASAPWTDNATNALQSQTLKQLKPKALNFYKVTNPPTTPQLEHASRFFNKHAPTLLASFPEFRLFPDTATPEVCFLGRSNVGKSSLINALFRGHKSEVFAHVSKKAGRTTTMNAFAVGPSVVGLKTHGVNKAGQVVRWEAAPKQWAGKGGLVLIDLQGYGLNSREKWGQEIMKLLTKRKQLRRAFVLIDAKDGLKDNDINLLSLLRNNGVPHQIVFTKADRVLFSYGEKEPGPPLELVKHVKKIKDSQQRIWELLTDRSKWETSGLSALCDILVTIADKDIAAGWRLGIDPLRFAILQAAGLDCDREGRRITAAALAPVVAGDTAD